MKDPKKPSADADRDLDRALAAAAAIVEDENRALLERLASGVAFGDRQRELSGETGAPAQTPPNGDRGEDETSTDTMGQIEKWRCRLLANERLTRDEANECK